ncbi:LPXTG-site transpeptidase (sortase) family protein [Streptomyces puniciscabiei]|uniref:LPXTG-site transpeptidase (Sortase) family protein n=1 Tax=Streptomyces puniciscabiei TaxID=164348 RepID=A0A542TIN5_9ACTN|nr:class F sortase [Streptomyces puniciscabiei]TQK86670.1 LPXTG-site transpeptidase (sortase) family protein [Streptomyces puniciscabiei]
MAADPSSPTSAESRADGRSSGRGGRRLTLWGVAIVVLAVSLFGGHHTSDGSAQASRAAGSSAAAQADPQQTDPLKSDPKQIEPQRTDPQQADPHQDDTELPRSTPTRLLIPKIAVDAPFTTLNIGASGQLEPPPAGDTNLVGWYAKGASPGEKGTAIIAGHVDTKTSAAVFANLNELQPGDRFTVERADGRDADFVVDDKETFAKDAFPSERVYADAERPEVRLITCAGEYDHDAKDYTDNLVVFGHLV